MISWLLSNIGKTAENTFAQIILGLIVGVLLVVPFAMPFGGTTKTVKIALESRTDFWYVPIIMVVLAVVMMCVLFNAVFGMTILLSFATVYVTFFYGFSYSPWILSAVVIVFSEILFMLDKSKICDDKNVFWFTLEHKLEALIESALIVFNVAAVIRFFPNIAKATIEMLPIAIHCATVFAIVAAVSLLIVIWVWINSLRYKRGEK